MTMLVGRMGPDFTAPAVLGDGSIINNFNLRERTKGKYAVIVFYPLDFTFVCPSELIALDHRVAELKAKGVEVISVSIDSENTIVVDSIISGCTKFDTNGQPISFLRVKSAAEIDKPKGAGKDKPKGAPFDKPKGAPFDKPKGADIPKPKGAELIFIP